MAVPVQLQLMTTAQRHQIGNFLQDLVDQVRIASVISQQLPQIKQQQKTKKVDELIDNYKSQSRSDTIFQMKYLKNNK